MKKVLCKKNVKKMLSVALALFMVIVLMPLASINVKADTHTHSLGTQHAAVTALGTTKGNVEYYDCRNYPCSEKLDASENVITNSVYTAPSGYTVCSNCHGRGRINPVACGYCTFTPGWKECSACAGDGLDDFFETCTTCGGAGHLGVACETCNGTGEITTANCGTCGGAGILASLPTLTVTYNGTSTNVVYSGGALENGGGAYRNCWTSYFK